MVSFLEKVIDEVYLKKTDFKHTCFVLPNKRSSIYFKRALLNRNLKTSFCPDIYTIDEFIIKISELNELSQEKLLLTLYESYLEISNNNEKSSFNDFFDWGKKFLNDVSEIEQNLLNPTKILEELVEINKLQNWSETELVKKRKNEFWSKLPRIYEKFRDKLLEIGSGTKGICYFEASRNLEYYKEGNLGLNHFFIGLNALTKSEESIINELIDLNKGDIFWDIDGKFLENKFHNSSLYIKKYKHNWKRYKTKDFKWVSLDYQHQKKIKVISCPNFISQANQITTSLNEINKLNNKHTAVVLGDESLIGPYLNVNEYEEVDLDISVNKKIDLTEFTTLINDIFSIQKEKSIFSEAIFNDLFGNDFFKKFFKSYSKLNRQDKKVLNNLFVNMTKSKDLIKNLKGFFELMHSKSEKGSFCELQTHKCNEVLNHIENLVEMFSVLENRETLLKITIDKMEAVGLRYHPNQSGKIKIMGILESRCLNYENVIISSVNEGVLPKGKTHDSLIPYDLKKKHGLMTHEERDAIYTYHFYRLIKRAKNIYLIYNSNNSGMLGNEKSRFIHQLEFDKTKEIVFNNSSLTIERNKPEKHFIKTPQTLLKLKKLAMSGFSPSVIELYIKNPVDFYFKALHAVRDNDEETDLSPRVIGIVFHEIMELLYSPYVQQTLDEQKVLKIIKNIESVAKKVFLKNKLNFKQGKGLIIFEVIKRAIKNMMKIEIEDILLGAKIEIIELEKKLNCSLEFKSLGFPLTVKGVIDRIDKRNGTIRIIDYKTGSINSAEIKLKNVDSCFVSQKTKSMQLLCYSLMFLKNNPKCERVQAGLICLRDISKGFNKFGLKNLEDGYDYNIDESVISKFEKNLENVIKEIFDSKVPFKPNS